MCYILSVYWIRERGNAYKMCPTNYWSFKYTQATMNRELKMKWDTFKSRILYVYLIYPRWAKRRRKTQNTHTTALLLIKLYQIIVTGYNGNRNIWTNFRLSEQKGAWSEVRVTIDSDNDVLCFCWLNWIDKRTHWRATWELYSLLISSFSFFLVLID
jgi:hypothetical protein